MSAKQSPDTPTHRNAPSRRRKLVGWLVSVLVICVVAVLAMIGGAVYYTERPDFCGSCHIMEPYYTGWQADMHSDPNSPADCVDCHYAPGEQYTLMAKFRGLSQAASYFSGRAGAGRPKAHVQDASCLRAGCHDDLAYMATDLAFGNLSFSHTKHLDPNGLIIADKRLQLHEVRDRLVNTIGQDRVNEILTLARTVEHADRRNARLRLWAQQHNRTASIDDVLLLAELVHMEVRIDQLQGLKCASCHQFDASLTKHFAVAGTTCYTCHFISQPFNAGTGRCLLCHEPPAGDVPVHYGQPLAATAPTTIEATDTTMDHAMIIANNVSCAGCHIDLIHGDGQVDRRDCENCHDQRSYLEDFDLRTTEVVRYYHDTHAAGQLARCNDCHQLIDHKLIPLEIASDRELLLVPVRENCQHCHPGHHREQVELLLGRGGYVGTAPAMPNPMTGSRANCRACHTQSGADPKGEQVISSTRESCRACHGEDYETLYNQWRDSIQARLDEARLLAQRARKQYADATAMSQSDRQAMAVTLAQAEYNIQFVTTANGMHNKNYSLVLLDQAVADLDSALRILSEQAAPRLSVEDRGQGAAR